MKFKDSTAYSEIVLDTKDANLYSSKATFKAYDNGIFIYQIGKESKGKVYEFVFIPKKNALGTLLKAEQISHLLEIDVKYFEFAIYLWSDGKCIGKDHSVVYKK